MLRTKSVYAALDAANDGLRILATRLRGRGLHENRYDVWMANLGPSEELLKNFRSGKVKWRDFSRRYKAELRLSPRLDKRNPNVKNHGQKFTLRLLQLLARDLNITLMCHCNEAEAHCHRHILAKLLNQKIS
jgi:uncharacterized protein YeaO (DUF488 family)